MDENSTENSAQECALPNCNAHVKRNNNMGRPPKYCKEHRLSREAYKCKDRVNKKIERNEKKLKSLIREHGLTDEILIKLEEYSTEVKKDERFRWATPRPTLNFLNFREKRRRLWTKEEIKEVFNEMKQSNENG